MREKTLYKRFIKHSIRAQVLFVYFFLWLAVFLFEKFLGDKMIFGYILLEKQYCRDYITLLLLRRNFHVETNIRRMFLIAVSFSIGKFKLSDV